MEKQTKSLKLKFLRFLPKAAAVSFKNPPYSPTKTHSGKIVTAPMIPTEARSRLNKTLAQEPTSPKISCIGQIKHKKKNATKQEKVKLVKRPTLPKDFKLKKEESIRRHHVFEKQPGRKSDAGMGDRAPSLRQMKRFASGRESMGKFDWTTHQISPAGEDEDEEEVIVPFSAPMVLNGKALEPKKEINLWRRRPMAQPRPLSLDLH